MEKILTDIVTAVNDVLWNKYLLLLFLPVSYTHLDVYKRQEEYGRLYRRGAGHTGVL